MIKLKGKKILSTICVTAIALSQVTMCYAEETRQGRNLKQQSIDTIEKMPNSPSNYKIIDWLKRGKELNDFIFDYTATDFSKKTEFSVKKGRTFSTIYRDDKYGGYMIPAFYGENRPLVNRVHDGEDDQESISVTSALIAASLMGIDMNKQLPQELKAQVSKDVVDEVGKLDFEYETYLDNALKFFWTVDGTNIFTNVPNGSMSELQNMPGAYQAFDDFWYMLIANQNFFRLAELNPDWRPELVLDLQKKVADKMCKMVENLGNGDPKKCDFNIQGYNFKDMKPVKNPGQGRVQPDAAVGTANILYYAYKIFKDTDSKSANHYLEYSKYCMDYLEQLEKNPYYENMLIDAVYLSTMMNAEQGTNYDTSKYIKWITTNSSSSVRNWGGVNYSQDGIDVYGMTGEPNNGYSYFFNSAYPMTSILPAAKYDPSYARMAGKWANNIANNCKYFLPSEWSEEHQTDGDYKGKKEENVLAYESLRKNDHGQNFYATGDAKANATSGWMAGENTTNFGLYGGFYTGFLGALVHQTNVENILQLDCNKTDYYQDDMYQSYLYYNPNMESCNVEIDLGNKSYDLYDSVTGTYLVKNVTGKQSFKMLADSARVIVLAPANSHVTYDGEKTFINDVLVASSSAEILPDAGTELISSVMIDGVDVINQKDQVEQYHAIIQPQNVMDCRIIWAVVDESGNSTDKATMTKDGLLTVKKNGKVKIIAKTIDGSGVVGEKIVTITGQTLASLSQDKKVVTSSVGDNHQGSLAVDGDVTTRWIANSSEAHPWIYVDLGSIADVNTIVLNWEDARPPQYQIQISDDADKWETISTIKDEGNSKKVVRFEYDEAKSARYVRIYTDEKSHYGCSLYEFDVYGNYQIDQAITSIEITSENSENKITTKDRPLQLTAHIHPENATDQRVEWYVYDELGKETQLAEITSSGKLIPHANGKVKVVAKAVDGSQKQGELLVTIENQDKDNLAYQKTCFASNQEGANPVKNAFDGKVDTRWASGIQNDNHWITVDLGDVYNVNKVVLYWEAFPSKYKIQGSLDNVNFTDLYVEKDGKGQIEEKTFEQKPARYVRMQCEKRSGQYGSSLWEFQVYGNPYEKTYVQNIQLSSDSDKNEITKKNKQLQLYAKITPENATVKDVIWNVYDVDGKETDIATISQNGILTPKNNGTVKVVAKATDGSGKEGELFVTISNQDVENIALNKTATASSQTDSNNPKYTIDGKLNTRWASEAKDTEFITIDLHGLYTIDQITLNWETAYGKKYLLQGSLDGENFFELYHQENGQGHIENIYLKETTVRYVRMQGIQRGTGYGYSLYEIEVYGKSCKANLQSLYEKYQALDESLYTPDSYKDFALILAQVKIVLENEAATLDEIQTVSQSLEMTYKNLILKADKTVLKKVIDEAEKLDSSLYTSTSYKVLINVLSQAKIVLEDENVSTEDVTKVLSQLQTSMTSLVERADTALLQTIINQAKAIDNKLYTKVSIQKLNMVLSQVEKIYENKDATQKQVDKAVEDLNAAIKALVKKADKKALEKAIQEAKAIDTKLYTDETVEVLTAVLKEAEEIYKDETATQETVDTIVKKLQEAVEKLEEKEVDIVVTPDKPDENKPDENKPGEPEQNNNQPTTEEKVETSDNTQYQMYIGLLGISMCAMALLINKKKKNQVK